MAAWMEMIDGIEKWIVNEYDLTVDDFDRYLVIKTGTMQDV